MIVVTDKKYSDVPNNAAVFMTGIAITPASLVGGSTRDRVITQLCWHELLREMFVCICKCMAL